MARDHRSSMLSRGVQVLQAFRPDGGTLTLSRLVDRTGLPKATVHRLAEELVELGLLERQLVGYRPGLGLFELGELITAKVDLREAALPYLQDLYEATHETVHLGIRDGLDVVYAEKIRGHGGVDVPSRVGGRLPLSSTGVGKVLLAFGPADIVQDVLSRPLRCLTAHSVADAGALARELKEIRRTGVAREHEEAALGVACIAAPVIVGREAVAGVSLAVPAGRSGIAGLEPALRTVSLALAGALGAADAR